MAANNSADVPIAAGGKLYYAPVGSTLPTDATTAPDAAFIELGYLSPDGLALAVSRESNDIPAWQTLSPIRSVITGETITASFTLLQWDEDSLVVAFGGGTWGGIAPDFDFTLPQPDGLTDFAYVLDAQDGAVTYRLVFPQVTPQELDEIALARGEAAGLGVTVKALADGSGNPLYMYINRP